MYECELLKQAYIINKGNYNIKCVQTFNNLLLNYNLISKSNNFNVKWIKQYPNKPWDYNYLYKNKKITKKDFIELDPEIDINKINSETNFSILLCNPNFNIYWIYRFDKLYYNINKIINHNNFKMEWVDKLNKYSKKKNTSQKLLYTQCIKSPNFNIDWIKKYPYEKWDFDYICSNYTIDLYEIYNNPTIYTNKIPKIIFSYINTDITKIIKLIKLYDKEDRNNIIFNYLSKNKNLTLEWLKSYPNEEWDYLYIITKI